jgi:riboflavin-specific deaminase-like protein
MKRPSLPVSLPKATAAAMERTGVDALWTHCLAIAAARRSGTAVQLPPSTLRLTDANGWQLDGQWDAAAEELFQLLKPLLDCRSSAQPWVIAQLGQSLDGFIATHTGDSHFVNGPENLLHLHRLRALADAVIVGAGTVATDNPQLTTRRVPGLNPVRVLFDPQLQLARHVASARVFTDGQAPTLWLCDARWQHEAVGLAGEERVLAVPRLVRADGSPEITTALAALHARGLRLLFVEGGGVTVSRFLAQGCLDRLHLALAPLIIGNGRPGLRFAGAETLGDCPRPRFSVHPMGRDQLWDLDLSSQSANAQARR